MNTRDSHHHHASGQEPPAARPTAVIVHLSGPRRGTTQRLHGERITIGTAASCDVRLAPTDDEPPRTLASLTLEGEQYRLGVEPEAVAWVNGTDVRDLVLDTGDVIEFGRGGPILRYRVYPPGSRAYKSVREAFSDCAECARRATEQPVKRTAILAAGLPKEIATQTSRLFRTAVLILLALLLTSTAVLTKRSIDLEARLSEELSRVSGLAELSERNRRVTLDDETLAALRAEVEAGLSDATRRIEGLEARAGLSAQVVERTMASTLFVQGSYVFREPGTHRPLRHRLDRAGRAIRDPFGAPALTLSGDGPIFEVLYTGTAFVIDAETGMVATNRHVAIPWEFDEAAGNLIDRGLTAEMGRFQAFAPGHRDPIPLAFVSALEEADVAIVQARRLPEAVEALELVAEPPRPGEEVFVIGFPLGIRALIARAEPTFLDEVSASGDTTFWGVARALAERGDVLPLASRGIVGQVTERAVVYDAETTHGGSGGPVISLDGRVVAVNSAIVPEFGGSNLGVPARHAIALYEAARSGGSGPPAEQRPPDR